MAGLWMILFLVNLVGMLANCSQHNLTWSIVCLVGVGLSADKLMRLAIAAKEEK